MTVADIVNKISRIDTLKKRYDNGNMKADDFEELVELILEYRSELLHKKVVG